MISSDDLAADDAVVFIIKDGGLILSGNFHKLVKNIFDELVFCLNL